MASFYTWHKIHKHFYAHLKAKARQLRTELKTLKKGTKTVSEFITKLHSMADSLAAIGDEVKDQDLMDIILEGLPEEYNAFVMILYGKPGNTDLMELESLLLLQEAQLEKFKQELTIPAPSANAVQAATQPPPQANATTAPLQSYYHNNYPTYMRG